MNIAICDDIKLERKKVAEYLNDFVEENQIFEYDDGNILIKEHMKNKFDLIFLDIIMPAINGIEVATKIREKDATTPIVFFSSTSEFAFQGYRVRAFDYLLKPIKKDEFQLCYKRFMKLNPKEKYIVVNYLGVKTKILLSNIVYIESNLRKLIIHLDGNKEIIINGKLGDYFYLTEEEFCRCHKSFIVNLNYVAGILNQTFNLTTGMQIKISRQFFSYAKKTYFDYLFGKSSGNSNQ